MKKLFISYIRKYQSDIKILAQQLKFRGIKLWRDVDDLLKGYGNESQIVRAIRKECFGFLLYITPDLSESDFVRLVEIPTAFKKLTQDDTFMFIPVFKNISPLAARKKFNTKFGFNIGGFDGFPIKGRADLTNIPTIILRDIIRFYWPKKKQKINVALHSKQYTCNIDSDLDMDFSLFHRNGDLHKRWKLILNAITEVKNAISSNSHCRHIVVKGKFHLSLGLCFGYIFRSVTGFDLKTEQNGQIWSSKHIRRNIRKTELIRQNSHEGNLKSRNLIIEIGISQNISNDVNKYISSKRLKFRRRLIFTKRDMVIANSRIAGKIISQIADQIKENCRNCRIKKTHLFMSVPLSFAVLLGPQLNACGQIQCYEYDNTSSNYIPCFLIG